MTFRTTTRKRPLARLLPWLLGFFVAAQIVASAHAAAFGESKHAHDGHPCIISTACKQASSADLAGPLPTLAVPEWQEHHAPGTHSCDEGALNTASSIRAPPARS